MNQYMCENIYQLFSVFKTVYLTPLSINENSYQILTNTNPEILDVFNPNYEEYLKLTGKNSEEIIKFLPLLPKNKVLNL